MKKLIVEAKDKNQLDRIKKNLSDEKIAFESEEEYESRKQIQTRREFVEWVKSLPK